jgi:hypothetical protein
MNLFKTYDLYCERTSPDFWAEPVNALTNICFLIAAWFGWRQVKKLNADSRGTRLLLVLICCIGAGSFLFHTFATLWARLLDVLPILLLQLAYTWLYFRKIIHIRFPPTAAFVAGYLAFVLIVRQAVTNHPDILNSSWIYAPAMMLILALAIYHAVTHRHKRYVMAGATGIFALSLTFRSTDLMVCRSFPLGTHFMWHILNPIVFYMMLLGLTANIEADNRESDTDI